MQIFVIYIIILADFSSMGADLIVVVIVEQIF